MSLMRPSIPVMIQLENPVLELIVVVRMSQMVFPGLAVEYPTGEDTQDNQANHASDKYPL